MGVQIIRRTSPAHTGYQVEIRTWDLQVQYNAAGRQALKNVAIRLIPLSYALLKMKSEFAMLVFIKLESETSF